MAGKPPKVKPVPTPNRTPESGGDGTYRPPSPPPSIPHLTQSYRLDPSQSSSRVTEQVAMSQTVGVKVSSMLSAIDEFAALAATPSLEDYWIPTPRSLGEPDAQGIRLFKQRQYVAVDDVHFVQVARDAESGLFRATLARELNPSGPVLKPDGEGRLWLVRDNSDSPDHVARLNSLRERTAELLRSMGHPVDDFFDVTIARILAASGMGEALVRDPRFYPWSLDLLHDTVRRFRLDQKIRELFTYMHQSDPLLRARIDPHLLALVRLREGDLVGRSARRDRNALFQDSEHAFELDCDENTLQMRRIFPDMPKALAQALWRDASAADRLHMHDKPGMTRSMAEEALVALRDFRLARACEGLYLDSVSSLDSDRLAMHMIEHLAGWPQNVRIEIRQGLVEDGIGGVRTPFHHVLLRQDAGYVIHSTEGLSSTVEGDLYSTVWGLLHPEQRQAFGVTEGGGQALKHLIRAQPLPPRQVVSEALGLAPLPGAVAPAAVQYRQTGGLRGGADNNPLPAKSVTDRVRDLYPQLKDEEVTAFINERLKSDPSGVLFRLETELATLRDELATWTADGVPPHGQTSETQVAPTPADRRQAREQFSAKLQDIWQRKSVSTWEEGAHHFSHYVDFSGELPRLSTRFEHITELILTANEPGARIGAFLDSFPNLECLGVVRIKMEEFPSGIFQMRQLRELTLDGCSLKLSEVTVEGLSRIETLTRLNLANNPLTIAPHVGYMSGLTGLMLSNANLSNIPSGMDSLRKLGVVTLHDNNISDVGYELFEIPDTQDLFVGLSNNPLSDATRQRINEYLENSSMDRKVEIQMDELASDSDSDSESIESGFSTGSDSD